MERNPKSPQVIFCEKCDCLLVSADIDLHYLGHTFSHKFLQCPSCKQVFIPEEIVEGKMRQVEELLEDK